jgi:signal transduction histidine kinase/CheY-like chemotaxis protein
LQTLLASVSLLALVLMTISVGVGALVLVRTFRDTEASLANRVSFWLRGSFEEHREEVRATVEGRASSESALLLSRVPTAPEAQRRFEREHRRILERRGYERLAMFDSAQRLVYAWVAAGVAPRPLALPDTVFALLADGRSLGGYAAWGGAMHLVGAARLRKEDGSLASGYLAVGRPVDSMYLAGMHGGISLAMRLSLDTTVVSAPVQLQPSDSLVALLPLPGLTNRAEAIMRASVDRSGAHLRFRAGLAILAAVLALGALVAWGVWVIGRRWLLDPLRQTVTDVEAMRDARGVRELRESIPVVEWEVLRRAFNDAARALAEFQRRYRDVFDRAADALFLLDPATGRVVDANPATSALTGVAAPEMIGRVLPTELAPLGPGQRVVQWPRADGASLTWGVAASEIKFDGGAWLLAAYRDLTGRETMAHTQKMEAVGLLAGGIAHDFNNLLGAVLTGVTAARALAGPGHPSLAALDGIEHAGVRAAELTRQLLTFSRHDPLRLAPVDVERAIAAVRAICERTFDRRVAIETAVADDLPPVLGDAGEIEQAVLNLCINARDAMPSGGSLGITARRVSLDAQQARDEGVQQPGVYIVIAVTDTGVGMAEEVRARVFEPFFTTKEPGKGTGLGLPMVYGLVRQLGGAISVSSAPSQGTRVQLLLPAISDRPARAPAPAAVATARGPEARVPAARAATTHNPVSNASSASTPAAGPREALAPTGPLVLLVDDEQTLRDMLRLVLELAGYSVLTAADGSEALARLHEHPSQVRAVLLDVQLPGALSGIETFEQVRAIEPDVPVLLCTGYVREEDMARLRMLDVDDVLLKPLEVPALIARLEALTGSARRAGSE